jgi:hypothetical protein
VFRFNIAYYKSNFPHLLFALAYLCFFVAFFSINYHSSIPGLLDAIMNINIFNQYEVIATGGATSFYPYKWFMFLGDPVPALSLIFHFFKLISKDNFIAYKTLLVFIFATNAFSVSLLSSRFLKSIYAQFAVGLLFATNQYLFNLNDNPNILFFAPGMLAIYLLSANISQKKILLASLLLGVQLLCGFYSFVICGVILIAILLYNGQLSYFLINPKQSAISILIIAVFLGLLFFPLAYFKQQYNGVNPMTYEYCRDLFSLKVQDIFSTHVSSNSFTMGQLSNPYLNQVHAAFPGVVICIAAILGLINFKKIRWLLILFLAGFLLASGPEFNFKGHLIPNLFSPHYYFHQLVWVIRIPVRLFIISVFALCIMAGVFMDFISSKNKTVGFIVALLIVLAQSFEFFCFSNSNKISSSELIPPQQVQKTVARCTPPIFFLPAGVYSFEADKQQYIYMYWLNTLKVNITTGYNGYNPATNIDMYRDIRSSKFDKLLNSPNWNSIVFVDTPNTILLNIAKEDKRFSADTINGLTVIKRL